VLLEDDDDDVELVDLLVLVLDEAPPQPPASRVAALRAHAEAAREQSLRPRPRRAAWLVAVAAVGLGVLGGVGADRLLDGGRSGPSASGETEYDGVLYAPSGEPAAARLSVVRTGIGRVVELETEVLPILPAGELYEVWFVGPIGEGEPPRISAGTFHPDHGGRSHVRLAAAVDPARSPTVEITAEPGDGDPAATGPVVLRATIGA
jgi:hypothetical protein